MSNDSMRPYNDRDDEPYSRSNGHYKGGEDEQYADYQGYAYDEPRESPRRSQPQQPQRQQRSTGQQSPQNPQNTRNPGNQPTTRRLPPQEPAPRPRPNTGSRQSSTGRARQTNDLRQSSLRESRDQREYDDFDDETYVPPRPNRMTDVPRRNAYPETDARRAQSPRRSRYADTPARQARPRRSGSTERRPRRQKRVWPWLLIGCFGGILLVIAGVGIAVFLSIRNATGGSVGIPGIGGGTSTYTQRNQYPVPMSGIAQLQIHNQIGDVTISVDPGTTTPLVTTTKSVKATSQSDANKQFGGINVQVEPSGTDPSTLAVSASISDNTTIFSNHNYSVGIVISLPQSVNSGNTPVVLNGGTPISNITSVGNVTINGLNGVLNVKNDIGNITVQNATLSPGSALETGTGNVTFNGSVNTAAGSSSSQSIYTLQSEAGNLNVTLPATINVTLDAYTNSGNISSDFDVSRIKNADGSLEGPIIYGTTPNALLKLHVSTGNIALHRGA